MRGAVSKHSLLTGVYLLSTASCVSVSPMDAGLKALMGKDVSTAIAVLGKPAEMEGLGKDTLYVWTARRTEVLPETHTTDFSGMMLNVTVRTPVNVEYVNYCNVRILVNPTGRITNTAHDGNRNGCQDYGKFLRNYAEQAKIERQE